MGKVSRTQSDPCKHPFIVLPPNCFPDHLLGTLFQTHAAAALDLSLFAGGHVPTLLFLVSLCFHRESDSLASLIWIQTWPVYPALYACPGLGLCLTLLWKLRSECARDHSLDHVTLPVKWHCQVQVLLKLLVPFASTSTFTQRSGPEQGLRT